MHSVQKKIMSVSHIPSTERYTVEIQFSIHCT